MKRYIKATEYWSMDVRTVDDVRDEIDKAVLEGTTKEDIEDYLIELESRGNLDRDEFIELRDYAFGAVDRFVESKKSVLSSTSLADVTDEQKEYVYRCVAESPAPPDVDAPEEEWSVFHRDSKEYFDWAFADAIEDDIFDDDEYDIFTKLWEKASTDMAAPYA